MNGNAAAFGQAQHHVGQLGARDGLARHSGYAEYVRIELREQIGERLHIVHVVADVGIQKNVQHGGSFALFVF